MPSHYLFITATTTLILLHPIANKQHTRYQSITGFYRREAGFRIIREMRSKSAEDGQIALDMMKASAPGYYDMILMDIMMPNMNGLEVTRQIRKLSRPDSKTIPIVAMTANAFAEEQRQSVASGMNAHLSKPLSMEKLQETLKEFL